VIRHLYGVTNVERLSDEQKDPGDKVASNVLQSKTYCGPATPRPATKLVTSKFT
jgi:hypothetical protein